MTVETVVLVDEDDRVVGTMPKADVHGLRTPLHRGFSCYIFRAADRHLLIQQRSAKKKTWPLVWSNSCCGHPGPSESTIEAARRRIGYELGLVPVLLQEVAAYRYCFTREGIMENEICPIIVGIIDEEPRTHPEEVERISWIRWDAFLDDIAQRPHVYSEWCIEQARILSGNATCRWILNP